jgi:hypothetical protein
MVCVLEGDVAQQSLILAISTKIDRNQSMNLLHALFSRNL